MTQDENTAPDSRHDGPSHHKPSHEAWRALARIEKHEAVCAERYKDIDRRLTGIGEDSKANRRLLLGVGALIIAALLAAFFDILLLGEDRTLQYIYLDEYGRPMLNDFDDRNGENAWERY